MQVFITRHPQPPLVTYWTNANKEGGFNFQKQLKLAIKSNQLLFCLKKYIIILIFVWRKLLF